MDYSKGMLLTANFVTEVHFTRLCQASLIILKSGDLGADYVEILSQG